MLGGHEFRAGGVLTRCPVIVVDNDYGCALVVNDNVRCLAFCVEFFVVNINRAARIDVDCGTTSVYNVNDNINVNTSTANIV